jgi:cystathionine beta-lyase/cystathionine gamma-synthase
LEQHIRCLWIIFQSGISKLLFWYQQARNYWKFDNAHKDSFAESPTNPAVDIIDLELLGNIAKSTIWSNNWQLFCNALFAATYKMHLVHSATKLMDGQGRVLGGITVVILNWFKNLFIFRLTGPSYLRLMLGYCLKV